MRDLEGYKLSGEIPWIGAISCAIFFYPWLWCLAKLHMMEIDHLGFLREHCSENYHLPEIGCYYCFQASDIVQVDFHVTLSNLTEREVFKCWRSMS